MIWFMGQVAVSYIKIAKISLSSLAVLADNPPQMPIEGIALDSVFFIPIYIAIPIILIVWKKKKKTKRST